MLNDSGLQRHFCFIPRPLDVGRHGVDLYIYFQIHWSPLLSRLFYGNCFPNFPALPVSSSTRSCFGETLVRLLPLSPGMPCSGVWLDVVPFVELVT